MFNLKRGNPIPWRLQHFTFSRAMVGIPVALHPHQHRVLLASLQPFRQVYGGGKEVSQSSWPTSFVVGGGFLLYKQMFYLISLCSLTRRPLCYNLKFNAGIAGNCFSPFIGENSQCYEKAQVLCMLELNFYDITLNKSNMIPA